MNTKAVIRDAWALTQKNKPLMWWYAFFPEFIGLLVGISYLVYQFMSFWQSPIFRDYQGNSFAYDIYLFVQSALDSNFSLGIVLIVIASVVFLLDFTMPIFCKASLVQLIARMRNGQKVKAIDGVSYGFLHFLPLFKYHLILRTFSLIGIFSYASSIIRNLGAGAFKLVFIPFILFFIVVLGILLFLTYSEYFIIIDGKGTIKSMGSSARLVVRHWQHTFLMFILMLLITLRIFLNILLVLLIPSIIVVSTSLLATFALAKVGFALGVLAGLVGLYFAAYLGGILEVFSSSVWVFTFLELTSKEELSAREVQDEDDNVTTEWATPSEGP